MTAEQYKGLKIRDNGCVGGLTGTILHADLERGELIVSWKLGSFAGLTLRKLQENPGRYTIVTA